MALRQITDNIKLLCENETEKWRCDTFWTKEPETLHISQGKAEPNEGKRKRKGNEK